MIKAIFFDIDGTLLSYRTHQVLPGTIEAFRTLQGKGIKTFVSSGRPKVLIPDMPLHFDGYITVNGGYCFAGETIVHRNALDPMVCSRWLDYVEENNLTTMCFTDHEMSINQIDPAVTALHKQLGFLMPPVRPIEEMRQKEVYQFIAMQPAEKDAEVLSLLGHCRLPRWHPLFTDLIPEGSSKAVGITKTLDYFSLSADEAMAFGDGENDIEMLDCVGLSVAMGNATDNVKRHADLTTDNADNEGIFNALKKTGII